MQKSATLFMIISLIISSLFFLPLSNQSFSSLFTKISTFDPMGDDDNDGLFNTWEIDGVDINEDGTIDLVLPEADPQHKDIFVEIDYMELHFPNMAALQDVKYAFANAPISNPDGDEGINLHIFVDEEIPHTNEVDSDDLIDYKDNNQGNGIERANPNQEHILNARERTFHYVIYGHMQPGTTSSGESPWKPGMEFMVTLGALKWGVDPSNGHNIGSRDQQAGTFMHELGHNLGLGHGGWNEINCKSNYFSVMNYLFQMSSLIGNRPLDYSRSALAELNENELNEFDGIDQSVPPSLRTVYGPSPIQFTIAGIGVDWDRSKFVDNPNTNADINNIEIEDCGVSPGDTLEGYNDWDIIEYYLPSSGTNYYSPYSSPRNSSDLQVSGIDINTLLKHRLLLWESIRNQAPLNDLFNSTSPIQNKNVQIVEGILNETQDNMTNLLINNNITKAIAALELLRDNLKSVNNTGLNWSIDNFITVLDKQI